MLLVPLLDSELQGNTESRLTPQRQSQPSSTRLSTREQAKTAKGRVIAASRSLLLAAVVGEEGDNRPPGLLRSKEFVRRGLDKVVALK